MDLGRLGRTAAVYALGVLLLRAAQFLLIPLYTHLLPQAEYGRLVTLLAMLTVLIALSGLGARTAFLRFAARPEGRERASALFAGALLLCLLGTLGVTLAVCGPLRPLLASMLHEDDILPLLGWTCAAAGAHSLYAVGVAWFRLHEMGWRYVLANLATFLLLVGVTVAYLAKLELGVIGVLAAQATVYGGGALLLAGAVLARQPQSPRFEELRSLLSFGSPLVLDMAGSLLMDMVTLFAVSRLSGLETAAVVGLSLRLAQIVYVAYVTPIHFAVEPFVYRHAHESGFPTVVGRAATWWLAGYGLAAWGMVVLMRDGLSLVAPDGFAGAYSLLALLLPVMMWKGVGYFGAALLNASGKSKVVGVTTAGVSVLHVALCWVLVSRYGAAGAVLAMNLSGLLAALALLAPALRALPVPLERGRLLTVAGAAVALIVTTILLADQGRLLFYAGVATMVLATVAALKWSGFLRSDERAMALRMWQRLRRRAWIF